MLELTWEDVMKAVLCTAKRLEGRKVYGVPRGGTLVATLLSYRGCKLVATPPEDACALMSTIIVDDIADTGETLALWADRGFTTMALFIRKGCRPLPACHLSSQIIPGTDYIKFPWEDRQSAAALEAKGVFKDLV